MKNKNNKNEAPVETNPYQVMIGLLHRAFAHFNKVLCDNELVTPIIVANTRGRKSALGWHAPRRWTIGTGESAEQQHEINICAEVLDRPWAEICETLIHEMAHLYNTMHDIKDCNAVQYHNKHFKDVAERYGLVVTKMKNKGFALTALGEKATKAIESLGIKQEDVPVIKRNTQRGPGAQNSFVLCTHEDKARFQELAGGMKQTEFFATLLDLYEGDQRAGRNQATVKEAA